MAYVEQNLPHDPKARLDASLAFLRGFVEGRPIDELRDELPRELEATGQEDAASIVRSFFHLPKFSQGTMQPAFRSVV